MAGRIPKPCESLAKIRLVTLFRWGVEQGLLTSNPIKGIRKPPQRSRGTQTLVTPEQHATLVSQAEPCFRDVLVTLWETGARPGEVTSVTAADFDAKGGVWVMRQHQNAHKGQSRIVYLTAVVVAICKRLAEQYPTGPLYRTQRRTPYGWCGLSKRMGWLRQRLGLPNTITVYGYRHTFATDALANGVPDAQVAELLGHLVSMNNYPTHPLPPCEPASERTKPPRRPKPEPPFVRLLAGFPERSPV